MTSFIQEWMKNPTVNTITDDNENTYKIRVLGRGTDLFFQENHRALICSIDAVNGVIYSQSIKAWDSTGEKISKKERERLLPLIARYYREVYNPNAVVQ